MEKEMVTLDLLTYDKLKEKARSADAKLKAKDEEFAKREKELLDIIEGLESGAKCLKVRELPNIFSRGYAKVEECFINCEELEKELRNKLEKEITEERLSELPKFKALKEIINEIEEKHTSLKEQYISLYKKVEEFNSKWYNFNKIKL